MDLVRITSLELDCIVGIRAYERRREQRVRLDLALGVDARRAGRSGRIVQTVDYDLVAAHLIAMLRFRRYQLIEMAAEELCAMLLTTETELMHVQLSIEKPGALEGRARSACVEVTRTLDDFEPQRLPFSGGVEREVLRTRDASISVLELASGQRWAAAPQTRCLAWSLSEGVVHEGRSLLPGQAMAHERGPLELENSGPEGARIFVCQVPPTASECD